MTGTGTTRRWSWDLGKLPEIVLAGEPGVATVTLEDKGLVELTVSFGQAAYEIKEGEAADIKVTVSPAADRRVEVPLVVVPKRGATVEDYSGVPASVVFEAGESQRTISVEVLMDDADDPGEGIVLSLGALAQAVSAGEPASTEVHFEQRRMAKRFSQTLEGMAAVIARSTAVSAQTAIEGRFERHRQWSRLGSAVGALPTAPPGIDNSAAALSPRESERIGPRRRQRRRRPGGAQRLGRSQDQRSNEIGLERGEWGNRPARIVAAEFVAGFVGEPRPLRPNASGRLSRLRHGTEWERLQAGPRCFRGRRRAAGIGIGGLLRDAGSSVQPVGGLLRAVLGSA